MKSNENTSELQHLFVDQLRDILWAEKHLLKALPKMAKAAKDQKLSEAFTKHQGETETHVERLGQIFSSLGLSSRAKKCQAMQGLLGEADELADDYSESSALDAALIAAAQKVEHYEIATYGTLRSFAECLGHTEAAQLLGQTLQEESKTDELLTEMARTQNEEALT
ncbi:MAG: ferritin-like domain-containing protein [Akkermansiaceae bacterium]